MATTFDLSGKSLLITGAGRGLGRALAIGAAQAGARVAALDIDATALLELRKASDSITTYVVDVVDRAAFMAAAGRIGRIDGVVNNAMLIRYDAIEAVDDAILDRMLAIGIKGAVWGVQALPASHGSGGRRCHPQSGLPGGGAGFSENRDLQHGQGRHGHVHPARWRQSWVRARYASCTRPRIDSHSGRRCDHRRRPSTSAAPSISRCAAWDAMRMRPMRRCSC
ncbi:MAG: SDR family NAD(P)-dependent oxidoreductase [Steroidobacteraceae bacterium]